MATALSQTDYNAVLAAINLYLFGTAPENQLHVDVIDRLAKPAVNSGFAKSTGDFKTQATDRPFTTLIRFAAFLGHP
jgi:hypothetical protein